MTINNKQLAAYRREMLENETATATIQRYMSVVTRFAEWVGDRELSKEAFRKVCKAALDYGANAQLYFKEDTGNLANKNSNPSNTLTATRPTNVKATAGSVEAIDPSTVSRSLIFGSETSIKVYFKLKEGAKIEDLSFTCKGFNVTEPVQEGSEYSVKITGIRSFELYKDFDLVISQGSSSMTVTYSPYAYANSKWESTTANLANLVKAMVAYGDAAKAIWG